MATTIKCLGQSALSATTSTDVYTVPADTSATISTVFVCNRAGGTTFRLSVAVAGEALSNKQYLYYDAAIGDSSTVAITAGITLGEGDVLRAYAGTANCSVNVFGVETTV